MPSFLFGMLALVLAIVAIEAFARANAGKLARNLRSGAGIAALGGAVILMLRGGGQMALALAALGAWLLMSQSGAARRWPWPGGGSGRSPRISKVVTDHLEMELDHDSGSMDGRVLKGFFRGRTLSAMRPVELAHLWHDCRFADPQSAQLIEAYLDRIHPTWREDMARQESDAPRGPDGRMTTAEALEILGLQPGATQDEIRQAHKSLMMTLHPDRGGSTYLAAKINEAKDVLTGS
jgi:hypothetical protein